jgi:ferredoxin
MLTWDRIPTPGPTADPEQAIDWDNRTGAGRGLLRRVEQAALAAKEPIQKVVGSTQLNPLYYSDTIAFFFLILVIATGVYLLMFYQYGYDISYTSVENMERFIVARVARAVHRYASGGLVIFAVLHAIRMIFMDRFRGPRWLAWLAGVLTLALILLAGITGYWLIWDEGAQLITQSVLNMLQVIPALAAGFYFTFLASTVAATQGWILMLLITVAHVALTLIAGVFYWYHIKRLKRPRFFPPRYWMMGTGALLAAAGLLFPAGMLPRADFITVPATTPLDPIFLFYLPPALRSPSTALWVTGGLLVLTIGLAVLPWLFPRPKLELITITAKRCTGCTHCVRDCPYSALSMVDRTDGSPFAQLAVVDPKLCVSCGICIGSCDTLAIALGDHQPEELWQQVSARLTLARQKTIAPETPLKVIFTCERHAAHGAHTYAHTQDSTATAIDSIIEVVPVTCVAMVNPGVMTHALEAGAAEVQVVGCPPNDCTNREGNLWMEERLNRTRSPKLKPKFKDAPIFTTWLAPDHFSDALPLHATEKQENQPDVQHPPRTMSAFFAGFSQKYLILAIVLLALGLLGQVLFTYIPFSPVQATQTTLQVALRLEHPHQVLLEVDDQPVFTAITGHVFEQIPVTAGAHHLRLTLTDSQGQTTIPLDAPVTLTAGATYPLELDQTFIPQEREEAPEEYDIDTLRNIIHDN